MLEDLVPLAFFLTVTAVVLGLARIIADALVRRQLIRSAASPDLAEAVAAAPRRDPGLYGALKWGLSIGGVGLALILAQFLPYQPDDPIVLGLVLVFAASGLLAYYVVARRLVGR